MNLIRTRLPLNMLDLLVPEGSTLPLAWVVLVGHREQIQTTADGRPVYGAVTAWHPILPVADWVDARAFAYHLGAASLGGVEPDEWTLSPVSDECPELVELYGVIDGHDEQTEVAIAPLTALLADEPQDGGRL